MRATLAVFLASCDDSHKGEANARDDEEARSLGDFPPKNLIRSEKVFPESGKAADVLRAFLSRLERSGAEMALEEGVADLKKQGDHFPMVLRSIIATKTHSTIRREI